MKALLNKEFKLCLHPTVFIYLGLVLMLLIPSYPYLVACFFLCNAIFFTFQTSRENSDAMYTAMLPVSKAQAVKAKCLFAVIVQIIDLALMAGVMALGNLFLNPLNPGGTDRSISFFAFAIVLYAIFNLIFFTSFYKTGYKAGSSFLKGAIGVWIWIMVVEGLMIASHAVLESGNTEIPFFRFLHEYVDIWPATNGAWMVQMILLVAGIAIYVLFTVLAVRISIRRFEKVDIT